MDKTNLFTSGNIKKELIRFSIPLLLGSALQQLYGMADILLVSRYLGTHASAAVGASSTIVTCLIGLFTGISAGAGLVISKYHGALEKKEEKRSISATLFMGIAGGFLLMAVGLLLSGQILVWMKTPKEILPLALTYLRIYFLSIPAMILYNLCTAIFQALGDSKRPVLLLAVGGILNVCLDAILIIVIPWGVVGAGIATLLSQSVSAIILFLILIKKEHPTLFRQTGNAGYILQILKIGVPTGIQSVILTLSNLVVQYYINTMGENAVSAFTIYFKIENLIYMPILAFGRALLVFTGQNLGAGNKRRIWKGMMECNLLSGVVTAALSILFVWKSSEVMHVFTADEAVISIGCHIITIIFPWYIVYSLMEITASFLRGCGRTFSSMLISMIFLCGSRVVFLKLFSGAFEGIAQIAYVYPTTWSLAAFVYMVYVLLLKQQQKTDSKQEHGIYGGK